MTTAPLIAVVDHDTTYLRLIDTLLTTEGYRTLLMTAANTAHETIQRERPDLVILDTWLEDREAGWELLQKLQFSDDSEKLPILICSSDPDEIEKRAVSFNERHVGMLRKPYDPDTLLERIKGLLFPAEQLQTPNAK